MEGNAVFTYLDAFCEDTATLDEMKEHYQRGGLGDVKVKNYLKEILENTLTPIRSRRAEYENRPEDVMKILKDGTDKARAKAAEVLSRVKHAMKINYFG